MKSYKALRSITKIITVLLLQTEAIAAAVKLSVKYQSDKKAS